MQNTTATITKYQQLISSKPYVPKHARMSPGVINNCFLTYLTSDDELLYGFLKEIKLLKGDFVCNQCGTAMKLRVGDTIDKYYWDCGTMKRGVRCRNRRTIRYGSWFSKSKLSIANILFITYGILVNVPAALLIREYKFSSSTIADWTQFVREAIAEYMASQQQPIGGPGKTVEIDESKFGKRKYNRGHYVEGQWVFGGVERESGKCFLVKVDKRDKETLVNLIKQHILPGSIIISDCWKAYDNLGYEGFTHLTVNHSYHFVDPETSAHTNTIESTWRHVKATLPSYNRQTDMTLFLADYMFKRLVKSQNNDEVSVFFDLVSTIDYSEMCSAE